VFLMRRRAIASVALAPAEGRGGGGAPLAGTVLRIARFSVHDGPGIRTTVFLKGCPMRCRWCHSPDSQRPAPELVFHADRCLACGSCASICEAHAVEAHGDRVVTDFGRCRACGACVPACPAGARELAGRVMRVDEVVDAIESDAVFFEESGGGATFSGGEPLMQPAFLEALLARCRDRGVRCAVDTCGLADPSAFARILPLADLVLFDVKIADCGGHEAATGVSNVRVIANLHLAAASGVPVRARFPLVPGFTDAAENVRAIGELLSTAGIGRVDVLPYHRAGAAKYPRLGLEYPLGAVPAATGAEVAAVVQSFRDRGLDARVEG
jgi:pyruvate formate lyase activating enzyme